QHLLQGIVRVPVELELHLHGRLRPVERVDLRLEGFRLDVGVAVPHHDLDARLRRTERPSREHGGEGNGEADESESLHERTTFLDSQFFIYRNTTERVRFLGLSGSRERAFASATAVRCTRTSSASGWSPPATTEAPVASMSSSRSRSTSPSGHTTVPGAASATGPCLPCSAG